MAECPHWHRRLIALDDNLEFAECLDCGEILENEPPPSCKHSDSDESLADA